MIQSNRRLPRRQPSEHTSVHELVALTAVRFEPAPWRTEWVVSGADVPMVTLR